jgi:hypothetical protein
MFKSLVLKVKFTPINIPIVSIVATVSCLAMVLFFVLNRRQAEPPVVVADTVESEEEPFDEIAYYNQLASEYIETLPMDKCIIATLIDSVNHNIVYYETASHPSCYSFDLETLTTTVLFGGENGFYVDTKLLIVGTIKKWERIDDRIVFIASNVAPGADYPEETFVFSMNIYTHQMAFVACVADADFVDNGQVRLRTARLLYRNLFTGEGVYDERETLVDLRR